MFEKTTRIVALTTALAVAGCGGSGGAPPSPSIASFSPELVPTSAPVEVEGEVMHLNVDPAVETTLVFSVVGSATPFDDGVGHTVEVPATVTPPATVRAMAPAAVMCGGDPTADVEVTVVQRKGTQTLSSTPFPVELGAPVVTDVIPAEVPQSSPTAITVEGSGFAPVGGLVLVQVSTQTGTPFQGGTSAFEVVVGLVTSATSVVATAPAAVAADDFVAHAGLVFPGGTCSAESTASELLYAFDGGGGPPPAPTTPPNSSSLRAVGDDVGGDVTVDPTDPQVVVCVGSRPADGELTLARSGDGGSTWASMALDSGLDGLDESATRSTPRAAFDRFGNLYVVYESFVPGDLLAPAERAVHVLRSSDGGVTFPDVRVAASSGLLTGDVAEPFVAIGVDGSDTAQDAVYVGWRRNGLALGLGERIEVSGAQASGLGTVGSLSAPVTASALNLPLALRRREPAGAVTPNGDLVVVWTDYTLSAGALVGPAFVHLRTDPAGLFAGATFGVERAVVTASLGLFDTSSATGQRGARVAPRVAVAQAGPDAGRIAVALTDLVPHGAPLIGSCPRARVLTSDDGGASFIPRILSDATATGRDSFGIALTADRITGALHASWYDARHDPLNTSVHRYLSNSADGGATWSANQRLSQGASNASLLGAEGLGDHQGLAAHDGTVYASWTDNSNANGDNPDGTSGTDVMTAVVTP